MKCQSCGRQTEVHAKKSDLFTNMQLLICDDCRERSLEPRWLVVLAGRTFGVKAIDKVLKSKRYVGKEITASELL